VAKKGNVSIVVSTQRQCPGLVLFLATSKVFELFLLALCGTTRLREGDQRIALPQRIYHQVLLRDRNDQAVVNG